jgi:hypothetical protein
MNQEKIFTKPTSIEDENTKDIFLKWSDTLTMHGFPNIFRTKHAFIKIFWVLLFIISASTCAFNVYFIIGNYLKYDVVTTIKLTREGSMTFPTISICNSNLFVTEDSFQIAYNLSKSMFDIDLYDIMGENRTKLNFFNSEYKLFENYLMLNNLLKQIMTNPKFKSQNTTFGFHFKKFVISCFYSLQPCYENDFVPYFDESLGVCYRFNSGKFKNGTRTNLKTSNKPDFSNGLMLQLFVGDGSDPRSLSLTTGAKISIHNDSLTPSIFEGFYLNVGTMSNVAVHKTFLSKIPYPYSDCTDNLIDIDSYESEYYRITMSTNNSYRQSDCFDICYQIYLNKKCNCYDPSIRYSNKKSSFLPCQSKNETQCVIDTMRVFAVKSYTKMCNDECPAECYTTSYSFTTSASLYPTQSYAHSLLKDPSMMARFENKANVSYETLKESILNVNIYFDSLELTRIEQSKKMEISDLISSVGGTLGLFLGISLLSIFEFIEIVLEILFSKAKKPKSNKIKTLK